MSRRCHHGSPRHARIGRDRCRPLPPERLPRSDRGAGPGGFDRPAAAESTATPFAGPVLDTPPAQFQLEPPVRPDAEPEPQPEFEPEPARAPARVARIAPLATAPIPRRAERPRAATPAPQSPAPADGDEASGERGATAPQLRRFIKSRAYVPMHELRRRFLINGGDDEVTAIELDRHRVFVGLPEREGRLLGELLRGGDIGYELSLDPISPIVVGVYPMRPVTRA
jgi:hypothetical protein